MLILTTPTNIRYFSGVELNSYERFAALIVCGGRRIFVAPQLERGRVPEPAFFYADGEDPAVALRRAVDLCGEDEILEIDGGTQLRHWEVVRRALGEAPYKLADETVAQMRAAKSEEEIGKIKRAVEIIKEVIEELKAELSPGVTERRIAAMAYAMLMERGAEPGPILVQFGENTALPHQGPTDRRLKEGDVVIFDFTAAYDGYYGDITRTLTFRGAPPQFDAIYNAVAEAQQTAISASRAGVRAGDVDEAARAVLRRYMLDRFFVHRTGHGLGLDFHELPNVAPGENYQLREGNVFTVEPGVYLPGRFGVRIEDDVAIVGGAARVL